MLGQTTGLLALILGGLSPARAGMIYTQGPDGSGSAVRSQNDTRPGGFGNFATVYDDFTLATAASITQVGWSGEYFNPPVRGLITGWTLGIYANNAGQPGALLNSTAISGTANETSLGLVGGFPAYSYLASLGSAFPADAGATYWVSVVPDMAYPPMWAWQQGVGGNNASYAVFLGSGEVAPMDEAITLYGADPVPEPGQLATLLVTALGVGGYVLRRRAGTKTLKR
jgi:hypothetical protein